MMFKVAKFYQAMVKNTHSIRSFMESFMKKLRECLESGREICIFAIENVKRWIW
jgi:hypothetical protein